MATLKTSEQLLLWLINEANKGQVITEDQVRFNEPAGIPVGDSGANTEVDVVAVEGKGYKGLAKVTYIRLQQAAPTVTEEEARPEVREGKATDPIVVAKREWYLAKYGITADSEREMKFVSVDYSQPLLTIIRYDANSSYVGKGHVYIHVPHPQTAIDLAEFDGRVLEGEFNPADFVAE